MRRKTAELGAALDHFLTMGAVAETEDGFDRLRKLLREDRHQVRADVIEQSSAGALGTDDAIRQLDAIRWQHRSTYHLWRIAHHERVLTGNAAAREIGTAPATLGTTEAAD